MSGQQVWASRRIATLERELAEAQQWIDAKCSITGCWRGKYEEVQGKLDSIQELTITVHPDIACSDILDILKGEK